MDATVALFSISLLLLLGIYGIYWVEGRRRGEFSSPSQAKPESTTGEPTG